MSNRARKVLLGVIIGVWAVVCLSYLAQRRLPDPAWAGVPPAAIVALAPIRRSDPPPAGSATDRESE